MNIDVVHTKICRQCRETKLTTDFYVGRRVCKVCLIRNHKKNYNDKIDYYHALHKKWYDNNREKCRADKKIYWETNKEKLKAKGREYAQSHKESIQKQRKKYDAEHQREILDRSRIANKALRTRIKVTVLSHYGNGKCACSQCGEDRLACLSIDHINGGGSKHRKQLLKDGGSNGHFYEWLIKNKYPEGYQTLCMNCQFIKRQEKDIKQWLSTGTVSHSP